VKKKVESSEKREPQLRKGPQQIVLLAGMWRILWTDDSCGKAQPAIDIGTPGQWPWAV
ncbi:hypothetical protein LEMLEM_LOCUS16523, partial [Lemmus lemmus]